VDGLATWPGANHPTDTGHPLLTHYDAAGERTALTAAALGDWAARVAALLTDGCGLGPGSRAAVLLPPHWQTAAVLLGAWSAGVAVDYHLAATEGLTGTGRSDAVFASRGRIDDWLVDVPDATHRFALDVGDAKRRVDLPDGYRDFLTEVSRYAGRPDPGVWLRATDPASADGTTYAQWGTVAQGVAAAADLRRGDRVLVDVAADDHPAKWLLAPLSAGATIVVAATDATDDAGWIATEGITRRF